MDLSKYSFMNSVKSPTFPIAVAYHYLPYHTNQVENIHYITVLRQLLDAKPTQVRPLSKWDLCTLRLLHYPGDGPNSSVPLVFLGGWGSLELKGW